MASSQPIPSSSSTTATITLETSATSSDHQQPQIRDALVLKLRRPKKKVSWKEGTVDNEFMNKKSSKKCCIYHKEKPFDEDDSDAEDDCVHNHDHGGESSKHGDEDHGNC